MSWLSFLSSLTAIQWFLVLLGVYSWLLLEVVRFRFKLTWRQLFAEILAVATKIGTTGCAVIFLMGMGVCIMVGHVGRLFFGYSVDDE